VEADVGKKKGGVEGVGRRGGILGKSVSSSILCFPRPNSPQKILTSQEFERILLQVQTLFNTCHPKHTPLLLQHCIAFGGHNPRLPTISLYIALQLQANVKQSKKIATVFGGYLIFMNILHTKELRGIFCFHIGIRSLHS
jgi:hypothetical protein